MSDIPTILTVKKAELEEVRQCIVSGDYTGSDLYELHEYENKLEDETLYLEELLQLGS